MRHRSWPTWSSSCASRPFDAIVHDSADLAAPIAASVLGLPTVNHSFGAMVPLSVLEYASELVAPLWRTAGLEPEPYAGAFRGLYVDISPPCFAWEEPAGREHPAPSVRSRGR